MGGREGGRRDEDGVGKEGGEYGEEGDKEGEVG